MRVAKWQDVRKLHLKLDVELVVGYTPVTAPWLGFGFDFDAVFLDAGP